MTERRYISLILSLSLCLVSLAAVLLTVGHTLHADTYTLHVAAREDCGGAEPCDSSIRPTADELAAVQQGENWFPGEPATSPPARRLHALTFDAFRARSTLYGGLQGSEKLSDTWEFDGKN